MSNEAVKNVEPIPPDTVQFDPDVVSQDVWQWQVDYKLDEQGVYETTFDGPEGDPLQGCVKLCLSDKPGKDGTRELMVSLITKRMLVGSSDPREERQNYIVKSGWTDEDTVILTFFRQASKDAGVSYFLHNFLVMFTMVFSKDPGTPHPFMVRENLFTEMATMAMAWEKPEAKYLPQCPRCGRDQLVIAEIHFGHLILGDELGEESKKISETVLGCPEEEMAKLIKKANKPGVVDVVAWCQQCKWRSRREGITLR